MNAASLRYRPMAPTDLDRVMEIECAAYPHPWSRRIFEDCLNSGYHCWLLEHATRPVGYGVMMVAVGEAHVLNLCVTPEHQGCGLGRGLMKYLFAMAKRYGAATMFLEVRSSNRHAYTLYQKLGFNEVGLRRNYYPHGKKREDAVIMALELSTLSVPTE